MTPTGIVVIIGAFLGAGGLGGVLSAIYGRRSTRESNTATASDNLINQFQEELNSAKERIAHLEQRLDSRDDYVMVLRQHISDRKPPPPPPYPREAL